MEQGAAGKDDKSVSDRDDEQQDKAPTKKTPSATGSKASQAPFPISFVGSTTSDTARRPSPELFPPVPAGANLMQINFSKAPEPKNAKEAPLATAGSVSIEVPKVQVVPKVGRVIEGTRFICFEMPGSASKSDDDNPDNKGCLTVQDILKDVEGKKRSLGMVIDLTDSAKHYNPYDFQRNNILHRKIYCPHKDHKQLPSTEFVNMFYKFAEEYSNETAGLLDSHAEQYLVGVHCEDGVGLTGYFACMYMVHRLQVPVTQAIDRFEAARGCKLSQDIYVQELKKQVVHAPSPPHPQPHQPSNIRKPTILKKSVPAKSTIPLNPPAKGAKISKEKNDATKPTKCAKKDGKKPAEKKVKTAKTGSPRTVTPKRGTPKAATPKAGTPKKSRNVKTAMDECKSAKMVLEEEEEDKKVPDNKSDSKKKKKKPAETTDEHDKEA